MSSPGAPPSGPSFEYYGPPGPVPEYHQAGMQHEQPPMMVASSPTAAIFMSTPAYFVYYPPQPYQQVPEYPPMYHPNPMVDYGSYQYPPMFPRAPPPPSQQMSVPLAAFEPTLFADPHTKLCWHCAGSDHTARQCPMRSCFFCGQSGHIKNDCPLKFANSSSSHTLPSQSFPVFHPPARVPLLPPLNNQTPLHPAGVPVEASVAPVEQVDSKITCPSVHPQQVPTLSPVCANVTARQNYASPDATNPALVQSFDEVAKDVLEISSSPNAQVDDASPLSRQTPSSDVVVPGVPQAVNTPTEPYQ